MADRYVIPAGGASNTTATWSATDGGAGGASIPISGDTVKYTATAGNLVWTGTQSFDNLDCTGATATMSGTGTLNILGDTFLLVAGMTYTATGSRTFTGANAAGTVTITTAGKTLAACTINGSGKSFQISGPYTATGNFTITAGTFSSQGHDMTFSSFISQTANTRVIDFAGSSLTLTGNLFGVHPTSLTWTSPDFVSMQLQDNIATNLINIGVAVTAIELRLDPSSTARYGGTLINSFGAGTFSIGTLSFAGTPSANLISCVLAVANDITIDECAFPEGAQLVSSANGTQRTITTGTNELSATKTMFGNIAISGGPLIAAGCIDLGNNSGITFQNFGANTHEITGVTYDNQDPPQILGGCTVTATKEVGGVPVVVGTTTSDAVTGVYTIGTPDNDAAAYTVTFTKLASPRGDAMCGITPTVP